MVLMRAGRKFTLKRLGATVTKEERTVTQRSSGTQGAPHAGRPQDMERAQGSVTSALTGREAAARPLHAGRSGSPHADSRSEGSVACSCFRRPRGHTLVNTSLTGRREGCCQTPGSPVRQTECTAPADSLGEVWGGPVTEHMTRLHAWLT